MGGGGGEWVEVIGPQKEKSENMKYFHTQELSKLAFLSSLTRKYMLWEGSYHDFSTKKVSASTSTKGPCPQIPAVPLPPLTIYPGTAPVYMDFVL